MRRIFMCLGFIVQALPACLEGGASYDAANRRCAQAEVTPNVHDEGCTASHACDDGDPCTLDRCTSETGACGRRIGTCSHSQDPICGERCSDDVACADDDPCTVDWCAPSPHGDLRCAHLDDQAYCEGSCSAVGARTPRQLLDDAAETPEDVMVQGTLDVDPAMAWCAECDDCYCGGAATLADESLTHTVLKSAVGPMQCRGAPWVCEPMLYGVPYLVSGRARLVNAVPARAPGGERPSPAYMTLDVADFCLDTAREGLIGSYRGTIDMHPDVATFDAKLVARVGSDLLTLEASALRCPNGCPNGAAFLPRDIAVRALDGAARLEFQVRGDPRPESRAVAVLHARQNLLEGRYHVALSSSVLGGELRLERVVP